MKGVQRVAQKFRPSLRIIDFTDDLRLVESGGTRGQLFLSLARFMALLYSLGIRYRA